MDYFTKKGYETFTVFLRRLKYEAGSDKYNVISKDKTMSGLSTVFNLLSKRDITRRIKVEVDTERADEFETLISGSLPKKEKNVKEEKEKEERTVDVKEVYKAGSFHGLRDLK